MSATKGTGVASGGRPLNALLRRISDEDLLLLAPHMEAVELVEGRILYNPGDKVNATFFPCGSGLISFVVGLEDGREVDALLVGHEGAAGGVINRSFLPAYTRMVVRFGGSFLRLPVARLESAKRKSATLMDIFTRYADCLLAETFQSIACNAAHSIEARAAKWIVAVIERTDSDLVSLTHDQLSSLLGVGRSYASRVIQSMKAEGIVETGRGSFLVRDRAAMARKSCGCMVSVGQHRAEMLGPRSSPP